MGLVRDLIHSLLDEVKPKAPRKDDDLETGGHEGGVRCEMENEVALSADAPIACRRIQMSVCSPVGWPRRRSAQAPT